MEQIRKFFKLRVTTLNTNRSFTPHYSGLRTKEEIELFPSNFISTSRYNIITFFPFSLLQQFARYANIYFLIIAILQSISVISPLNPSSAIAPLVFVLGLSMCREGYEDLMRHKSDNEVNATKCVILLDRKQVQSTWATMEVGDLVLVEENQPFPADLLVLGSSYENGVCYIETSSLDGEKNLKPKSAVKETQTLFNSVENYSELVFKVEAKPPTQALYEFDGQILLPDRRLMMGPKQLLLRGAYLRNTKWIIGIVVYSGQDTKIMRNAEPSRIKQSEIESTMNVLILGILCFQLVLCLISAFMSSWWLNRNMNNSWYLYFEYSASVQSLISFFSYFLLYNTMIPISLIVSMEFVKVFQSYFITTDEEMYVQQRNKYASVKTTTINEELGQVEYIFSDKTGTLTCNQMEFKYCIIGNTLYGQDQDNQPNALNSVDDNKRNMKASSVHPVEAEEEFKHSVFNFKDQQLEDIINGKNQQLAKVPVNLKLMSLDRKQSFKIDNQLALVDYYFFLLASAHECLYQVDKQGNAVYQGPSPDEITLVDAAAHLGYQFRGASASEQTFIIQGSPKRVEMLMLFEFDSDRKRMSAIVRDNGVIKLLVKGADSIIKARLATEQPYLEYIEQQLDEFSKIGLRCLLMATKIISEDEFTAFEKSYNNLGDSDNRQVELAKLTDKFERDLFLIGSTAVEDKLQFQVPETIADLLRANIKIWMLTGDKLETAENIAKSCRLIQGDMTVMRMSEKTIEDVYIKFQDNLEIFDYCLKVNRKKSLLVEGESLAIIISDPELTKKFVHISSDCDSVVCCRVTPKQKAQVVKMIKDALGKITLAIGDGANDVNMIQEAHIGVGLYGNEGMRAVQSSDFALGEFRCLWRLLLVHGHWSYIRISEMILYFFYKNMIFTVPQFYFAFFSAFSAQSFFDDWYITFYNMIFTALPLIIRATFDQDINYRVKVQYNQDEIIRKYEEKQEYYLKNKFPLFYYIGQQKTLFSIQNYLFWAFQGSIHGIIVFFGCYWSMDAEIAGYDGFTNGLSSFSLTIITAIIFIVNVKISMYTKFWTVLNWLSIFIFSFLIYFAYMIISHEYIGTLSLYTPYTLLKMSQFWLLIIITTSVVFLFDLLQGQIIRELKTSPIDIMRSFVNTFDQRLKIFTKQQREELQQIDNGDLEHPIKQQQNKKINKNISRQGSFWEEARKEEEKTPIKQE